MITSILTERRHLLERVSQRASELVAVPVIAAEPDAVALNMLEFDIPDFWKNVYSPTGVYWGQMKRVSNGRADHMVTMHRWEESGTLDSGMHRHTHDETFLVTMGWMKISSDAGEVTLYQGQFLRIPAMTNHSCIVGPHTCSVVAWFGGSSG